MSRGVVQEPSIYGRIGSRSGGQCWQADNRVMARRAEGSQRHVAARYRPLIVLLQHDRSGETNDGSVIRKYADHVALRLISLLTLSSGLRRPVESAQFTSNAFTGVLRAAEIKISMDGRGRWMDTVFIERLWRSQK